MPLSQRANPIQQENAKPGISAWRLTNPALNHEVEGYASLTSVNRGSQISLLVNTTDPSYAIEIYRMGWYGGLGARLVAGPIVRSGVSQVIPVEDPNNGLLIECNWTDPYVLAIPNNLSDPTDWCSGIYLAKLTGLSSGKQSYIIFAVRDDTRSSDFLFQSSVTTFQAYNEWGGRSLYGWGIGTGSCANGGGQKVSFNRPYFVCAQFSSAGPGVGAGEFLENEQPNWSTSAPAWEFNMVRFLEREGYDVTYSTDIDTHASGNSLLQHRAFLCVGHDEYWSWEMRNNVEAARDAGISLGFFCGNSCWWQVRFESSQVTGAPNRTMVCYKSTASDPVFGTSSNYLTTVNWPDSPVNRPQNTLIGLGWGYWGGNEAVDDDVIISYASHWVCAGTGLQNGDHLPGLVGYEADDRLPGAPPGTVSIAHSPVCCPNGPYDTGYSDITVYQAPSGALVFATGTIQWSWGLDDFNADGAVGPSLRPSRLNGAAQQMTRNVLQHLSRVIYVDQSYQGTITDGTPVHPFRTVGAGYAAAADGYTVRIAQNTYHEAPLILSKQVRLETQGGYVTISR
jgi:hypothetical protein